MKKQLLSMIFLVLILLCFAFPCAIAETASLTQDGVAVSLTTDKDSYNEYEDIFVVLKIKNTNHFPVEGFSVDWRYPDGYFPDHEVEDVGKSLDPAEEMLITINLTNGRKPPVLPQTGDDTNIAGWIVLLISSFIGILFFLGNKKCRRFNCMLLSVMMLTTCFGSLPQSAQAEVEERNILVKKQFAIGDIAASVSASVDYETNIPYTRAQWIAKLVERFGYVPVETLTPSYTDIAGTTYEKEIEAAAVHNLIPFSEGEFLPDEIATREFAAATAIRFLGFAMGEELQCDDSAQLTTPQEDQIAVDIGLMSLIGNQFYPNRYLSQSEATQIEEVIDEVLQSTEHTGSGGKGITFAEGVIVLPDDLEYQENGNKVIVEPTEETRGLQSGDVFVIGNHSAYKVQSVYVEDNSIVIEYSVPELEEIIDAVDIFGEGYLDFSQFIPAAGVTVNNNSAMRMRAGVLDTPDAKVSLDGDIDLGGNWKVKYGVSFEAKKVYYCFDIETHLITGWFTDEKVLDIKNVYLKLDVAGDVGASIERAFGDDGKLYKSPNPLFKEISLGYVPIVGADGFGALVEINLIATLDGSFTIQFDWGGLVGAQILNNNLRKITDLDTGLTAALAGEFKVGPELFAVAELFDHKLISFGLEIGAKAKGEVAWRLDGALVCIDGTAGVYGKLTALERTIIKEKLNLSGSWDFLDHDFLKGHWENLIKVDECTYNKAVIRGTVAEAGDRTKFIKDAKIRVYDAGNSLEAEQKSDNKGEYTVTVPSGTHVLQVSKSGYIPFEVRVTMDTEEERFIETLLMVAGEENTDETGTIGGRITNALSGAAVSDAKVTIRKNWNVVDGTVVKTLTTDADGNYSVTLPLGNYTVMLEKEGFVSTHINIAVAQGTDMNKHGTMVPKDESGTDVEGEDTSALRVVLTWGSTPSDLDSHMRGPTLTNDGQFHIYYSNKSYTENGSDQAYLDVDDTTSYGPETITVYNVQEGGTFSYYVHDFTNRAESDSVEMSNSGAQAKVYRGNTLLETYNIPTSQTGTVWHVFDYNADTQKLSKVNLFSSESDADAVGSVVRSRMIIISPDKK